MSNLLMADLMTAPMLRHLKSHYWDIYQDDGAFKWMPKWMPLWILINEEHE